MTDTELLDALQELNQTLSIRLRFIITPPTGAPPDNVREKLADFIESARAIQETIMGQVVDAIEAGEVAGPALAPRDLRKSQRDE